MKRIFLTGVVLLSACNALPRDPRGTSDRIEHEHRFTVGFADGEAAREPQATALLKAIETKMRAKAVVVPGSGEALLKRLEEGGVDLAIGRFRADSPWQTDVAFAPALRSAGTSSDALELKGAMPNGENRWIMTVEHASRAVAAAGQVQ